MLEALHLSSEYAVLSQKAAALVGFQVQVATPELQKALEMVEEDLGHFDLFRMVADRDHHQDHLLDHRQDHRQDRLLRLVPVEQTLEELEVMAGDQTRVCWKSR